MRDFLTGLAIVLIVVLTAALSAPYFVDWNGQRGFLEARLTHALGQKVTIGGNIDLKLLPTPYLVLDQTVIGGDDGPITIGIHHLDLELSVAPLLTGAFDITDARLDEPIMRVTLQRDRSLPALPPAPAFKADVRFDHVRIVDGTLAIADSRSGHTFVFDHLDFDAEAPALAGPYKGSGAAGEPDARTRFRFGTTASDKGRTHAHLAIDETPVHAGLEFDGTLALSGGPGDTLRQTFNGTTVLSGHLRPADAVPVAWRLGGALKADPAGATLTGGELRIGPEIAGLTLKASGSGDFDAVPKLHLDLKAKQLDIDRLSGAPVDAVKAPPPTLPDLASWRLALAAAAPPLPTSVDLAVSSATWGGEAFGDVALHLGDEEAKRRLTVSGTGPGGSAVALDGMLSRNGLKADGPLRFDGTIDALADNLPAAIDWLRSVAPGNALAASELPIKHIKLRSHLAVDEKGVAADGMALDLDRSALTGTARLDVARQPALLIADLRASVLDFDDVPSARTLGTATGALALDVALDAAAVHVDRVGGDGLKTGHLSMAFVKNGKHLALTRFRADDLGGATIDATGTLDTQGGAVALTLDAAQLNAAASLVRTLYPGDGAEALVSRAPALSPAKLKVDATLAADKTGALRPRRLAVAGRLGATTIDVKLTPKPDGALEIGARAEAPEGSALLRQLGFAALPIDTVGASTITLDAHGSADAPLATTIAARFGETRLGVTGRFDLLASGHPSRRVGGAGTATLTSVDLSPLLQSLAISYPDLTGRIPADGTAGLAFGGAGFGLSDLHATVGSVEATGSLQWEKTGGRSMLTGQLDLDRIALGDMLGLVLGPPQPPAPGAEWSNAAFGSGLLDAPASRIAVKAKRLDLGRGLVATDAAFDLSLAPHSVALRKVSATLAGGHLQSDVNLRRDGSQAALEGKLALADVMVELPSLTTRFSGNLDYAGSGQTPAGLVGSLAGTGSARLADTTIPNAGPAGLQKVFEEIEADTLAVDGDTIVRALEANSTPLDLGTQSFGVNLAAGALHFTANTLTTNTLAAQVPLGQAPLPQTPATVASTAEATLDLGRGTLGERIDETLDALPKGWSGSAPSIVVVMSGPPQAPRRSFETGAFINAVATRALARESARLEAYEFDIKERAFFNQRLTSENRREQDRMQAEAEARAAAEAARKAEVERRARAALVADRRAEAARLEKQRREEAARGAQKTAREKAEEDKQIKANADRAKPGRASQPSPEQPAAPQQDGATQADRRAFEPLPRGATVDPGAAGRY